jgi:hypothetical protein
MSIYNTDQFVINSGVRDNRSIIQNMPEGEEWVLDYKIVDHKGRQVNNAFDMQVAEYVYSVESGGYYE